MRDEVTRQDRRSPAKTPVILLNGASSSGKTTLARAVQACADRPFWHLSLDHLRDGGVLPMDRVRRGDFPWRGLRHEVFDTLHGMIGAVVAARQPLVIEHVLDTPRWIEELRDILKGADVLFVGLHAPREVLHARERARGDRPIGMADADVRKVHAGLTYDLQLNGDDAPDDNARTVLRALATLPRISDFSDLDD